MKYQNLTVSLELLFVTGMIITVVYSEKQVRTALDRQVRLERLQGDILHLDEVLTMSARMSAASGDLRSLVRRSGYWIFRSISIL